VTAMQTALHVRYSGQMAQFVTRPEVALGPEQGLGRECVASSDNVVVLPALLVQSAGEVAFANSRICQAVTALANC